MWGSPGCSPAPPVGRWMHKWVIWRTVASNIARYMWNFQDIFILFSPEVTSVFTVVQLIDFFIFFLTLSHYFYDVVASTLWSLAILVNKVLKDLIAVVWSQLPWFTGNTRRLFCLPRRTRFSHLFMEMTSQQVLLSSNGPSPLWDTSPCLWWFRLRVESVCSVTPRVPFCSCGWKSTLVARLF